ncbi:MAG: phenylalanine--tRNA ligase subunit alpha, partial [Spirochaetes bacterium]
MDLMEKLVKLENEAKESIEKAKTIEELRELTIRYLGRKSSLTEIMKSMKTISKELRPQVGKKANEVKTKIENLLNKKEEQIEENIFLNLKETEWVDITEPGERFEKGHLHPITI